MDSYFIYDTLCVALGIMCHDGVICERERMYESMYVGTGV